MVATQTQTQPDEKFEGLTKLVLKEAPAHAAALEDCMTFAWADHVRANKDDNGKGLGAAMYDAADKYVREELYGITGALPGNDKFQAQAGRIFGETIGLTKAQLSDTYKDRKTVHRAELQNLAEITNKSMAKSMQGILGIKLGELGDTDLDAFKAYVLNQANSVGAKNVTAEKMPTLHAATKEYLGLLPLISQYRGLKKAGENYGTAAGDEEA